jgi:AAA family ATP:ADP antiporter
MQVKESSAVERQPIDKDPLRSFPITKSEFPHFAAMSFMMFLFIYVFTTVRDTKDTLVVSNCGAEAIPFLKLYGVM